MHAKMRTHVILNALIARISCAVTSQDYIQKYTSAHSTDSAHWQENLHNIILRHILAYFNTRRQNIKQGRQYNHYYTHDRIRIYS